MDIRPCFIYAITHLASGRRYIGSCLTPTRRWIEHRSRLKCQRHHCEHLQRAWNKYGAGAFEFSILEKLPTNNIKDREAAELKAIANNECFNSRISNLGATNFINSKETQQKMNDNRLKRMADDKEYRNWLSVRGCQLAEYARTPERRAIRSKLSKQLWTNPEHRKKISEKLAIYWTIPGIKEEHSRRVKLHRGTADARKKNSEAIKRAWANPNSNMRNRKTSRWDNPNARSIQSEKLRAAWKLRKQKGD